MVKQLKDYLLEGGVKGKTFHHYMEIPNDSFFYIVEDIENKSIYRDGSHDKDITMILYSRIGTKEIRSRPIEGLLKDAEVDPSKLEQLAQSAS